MHAYTRVYKGCIQEMSVLRFGLRHLDPDLRTMCCARRQKGRRVCTEAKGGERVEEEDSSGNMQRLCEIINE
jgi:hypothetical protein